MTVVNIQQQTQAAFTPRGNVPSPVTPHGWERDPYLDRAPPNYARTAAVTAALIGGFTLFQPLGTIVTPVPRGAQNFFDKAFVPPTPVKLQQWSGYQPQGAFVPPKGGPQSFFSVDYKSPLSVKLQSFTSFTPAGTIVSVTPQGWARLFDYTIQKPFVSSEQQWGSFVPAGTLVSYTPQGWERFFDRARIAPVKESLQQFSLWQTIGQVPTSATPQGWERFFDRVVQRPLVQQQYETFQVFERVASQAWVVSVEPVQLQKVQPELSTLVVPPTQEQVQQGQNFKSFFSSIVTLPTVSALISYPSLEPVSSTVLKGSYFFDSAVRQPLSPTQQRDAYFTPVGTIVSLTPHGWERFAFQSIVRQPPLAISYNAGAPSVAPPVFQSWGFSAESIRVRRPIVDPVDVWRTAVVEVQYWGWTQAHDVAATKPVVVFEQPIFQQQGTITSVTPQGWERFFDSALTKPLSVTQQRDGAFAPQTPFVAPQGAPYFFDIANIEPLAAKLQQWEAFQPRGQIVTTTPQGWERFFDVVWTAPVKPSLQSFSHWQPLGQVPTPATPQGWERFFDRTVQKPLSVIYQQWAAFVPAGTITIEPIRPVSIQFDTNTIKPLTAALHRFDYFQPQGEITSTTPQGWERFFDRAVGKSKPINEPATFVTSIVQTVFGFAEAKDFVIRRPNVVADFQSFNFEQRVILNYGWSSDLDRRFVSQVYPRDEMLLTLYPSTPVVTVSPVVRASFSIITQYMQVSSDPGTPPGEPSTPVVVEAPLVQSYFDAPQIIKSKVPQETQLRNEQRREEVSWGWSQAFDDAHRAAFIRPILAPIGEVEREFVQVNWGWAYSFEAGRQITRSDVGPFVEIMRPSFVVGGNWGWEQGFDVVRLRPTIPRPFISPVVEFEEPEFVQVAWGWGQAFDSTIIRPVRQGEEFFSFRFRRFKGFLVCATIEFSPAVGASLVIMPYLSGTPSAGPLLAAVPSAGPVVVATASFTPALGASPSVVAC